MLPSVDKHHLLFVIIISLGMHFHWAQFLYANVVGMQLQCDFAFVTYM